MGHTPRSRRTKGRGNSSREPVTKPALTCPITCPLATLPVESRASVQKHPVGFSASDSPAKAAGWASKEGGPAPLVRAGG